MGPEISSILFYLFGAMAILCAIAVVVAKNPVTSAMGMALSFVATAAIFFNLNAQFLGIVQLIVYAGAILVLFLFIVMMLDIKAEERYNLLPMVTGVIIAGLFAGMVTRVALVMPGAKEGSCPVKALVEESGTLLVGDARPSKEARPASLSPYGGKLPEINPAAAALQLNPDASLEEAAAATSVPDTKLLGQKLFTEYNTAFAILGFALLAGTVGAVAIGRKFRKD